MQLTATSVYDSNSNSIANLDGECTPSATGRLSDICTVFAVASRDSTAVMCPHVICDSTAAAAASHHSTVVAVGSPVSAVVTTVAGTPATRAAAERLWPPKFFCEMSVNDSILGKFAIYLC